MVAEKKLQREETSEMTRFEDIRGEENEKKSGRKEGKKRKRKKTQNGNRDGKRKR